MKQFDDKIINKMKNDFNDYAPEYNPEHWNLMKEKLQNKDHKLLFLIPFWAKAAVITLFLTSSIMTILYFNERTNNSTNNEINFVENQIQSNKFNEISIKSSSIKNNKSDNYVINSNTKKVIKSNNNKLKFTDNTIIKKNIFEVTNVKIDSVDLHDRKDINKLIHDTVNIAKLYNKHDSSLLIVENKKKRKSVKFGAMLAGNSTTNNYKTDQQQGVSIGLSSEIPLNDKLSFNTGLVVLSQKFYFNPNASNSNYTMDAAPFFDPNITNLETNSSGYIIAMDIPMNMQLQLMKKKNKSMYCSFGLSSLAYFKEEYNIVSYNYVNTMELNAVSGNYENNTNLNIYNSYESEAVFNHFDFAKVINLSVSYRYKIFNGEIAIEPYIKYPYKPITSQAVHINFAGINLKYIF